MTRDLVLDAITGEHDSDQVRVRTLDGEVAEILFRSDLPAYVAEREAEPDGVRWIWDDTPAWYPHLLAAGVRVKRCHDLRLAHVILSMALWTAETEFATTPSPWHGWGGLAALEVHTTASMTAALTPTVADDTLFDLAPDAPQPDATSVESRTRDCLLEWQAQTEAIAQASGIGSASQRLQFLVAAESSGALAAAELSFDGLPFRRDLHEQTLESMLGPRPRAGQRPRLLEDRAIAIREALGAPTLNPDSPPHLLRELRRNGLDVASTSKWELASQEHPVIEPLLEYKSLARLASANGWNWMDAWVREGRFRSDYVPAGVITGRWSSRGGGALSLPKVIRGAVRSDEDWRLVVVDAAQLEPRILAAMAGDSAMLAAGARGDLYQGLVDAGVVDTRAHAKVAMLGALYGSTSGQSGLLVPRLARAYPRAIGHVDAAARVGEAGGVVHTWLGRTSPRPSADWRETQAAASGPEAGAAEESRARSRAREWGRFTRNFVVQGTAAEWALAWMGGVRRDLAALGSSSSTDPSEHPRLAFFLHDELVVHTPKGLVDGVVEILRESSRQASRLLFGEQMADLVPLDVVVAQSYAEVDATPEEELGEDGPPRN